MHSVLFVTLCLSTLRIVRKMHTKAGYSNSRGFGAVSRNYQLVVLIRGRFL